MNAALMAKNVNPVVSAGIGILEVTGVTDYAAKQVDKYINLTIANEMR